MDKRQLKSLSVIVCSFPTSVLWIYEVITNLPPIQHAISQGIGPLYGTVSVAHNEHSPPHTFTQLSGRVSPPNYFKRWLLFEIALHCSQITKKHLYNRIQTWLFLKKYTYRIPSAAWKGKRVNTLDAWWTQIKSSSHKFRLTAVSIVTWRAMLCLQLSSLQMKVGAPGGPLV